MRSILRLPGGMVTLIVSDAPKGLNLIVPLNLNQQDIALTRVVIETISPPVITDLAYSFVL